MFRELRNRLIMINLVITTVVLMSAFSIVFLIATRTTAERPILKEDLITYTPDVKNIVQEQMRIEREKAQSTLLFSLVITGVLVEISVAIVSYFLAEEAIKPVKKAYESQKIFIMNASHEIKTPIAAIQANLEAAEIKDNRWIRNVGIEAEKLAELNGQLLELAKIDVVRKTKEETEVEITEVVRKNLERFKPRLEQKGATGSFSKNNLKKLKIKLNKADFEQILGILFDNAVKYSKKEVEISVTAAKNGKNSILEVKNDGKTIPEDKIKHIFERFYQTDKSSEGAGLGLAIAKTLAERNHWELSASSKDGTTILRLVF